MAGGWTNDQLDELVAPTGTPFVPGNNVVGFGTTLPDELVAAGYVNAIVFYSSTWNPSATVPTIKFRFIATDPVTGDLILGYGSCVKPSVSQTAVVTTGLDLNLQGVVAPGGATFAPGNNVIGLGAQLPAELVAAGYTDALVFYDSTWNPTAVVATIKFRFLSIDLAGNFSLGYGFCANPSVSTVATVVEGVALNISSDGSTLMDVQFADNTSMFQVFGQGGTGIVEALLFAQLQNSSVFLAQSLNNGFVSIGNSASGSAGFVQFINNQFIDSAAGFRLQNINQTQAGVLRGDIGWTSVPLTNSWVSDAAWPAAYRMMPDGTVMFKGHITKVANPVSGENWMSGLPAAYRVLQPAEFLAPCGTRAYNNSANGQAVKFSTGGTALVFDCATVLSGDIVLDMVRYPVI